MQAVKDSFYMALRTRLAAVNPTRTTDAGASPAVLVCENAGDPPLAAPETFYLRWLGDSPVAADAVAAGWRGLRCEIAYRTQGTELACGEDRGRVLSQLDGELAAMFAPRSAELKDYTTSPESDLGLPLLWTVPKFLDAVESAQGIQRTVAVEIIWREDA